MNNQEMIAAFRQAFAEEFGALTELKSAVQTLASDVAALKVAGDSTTASMKRLLDEGQDTRKELERLKRTVDTIESFPLPYSRPKTFHYATELRSVSVADRERQGHSG